MLIRPWDSFTAAPLLPDGVQQNSLRTHTEHFVNTSINLDYLTFYMYFFCSQTYLPPTDRGDVAVNIFLFVDYTIWCFLLCVLTHFLSNWLCATSLMRCTWMQATIQRMKYVCGSRIMFWHSISLNGICYFPALWYRTLLNLFICLCVAVIVPTTSAPPSVFWISHAHKHKHTPVFAKGEKERWRETPGKHTEMAPFTFLVFEWVLPHDKMNRTAYFMFSAL